MHQRPNEPASASAGVRCGASQEGSFVRREAGKLEDEVLGVVGRLGGGPLAVAEVQERMPGSPAYTTVMTTMARLADKGALTRVKEGRAYLYRLAVPAESIEDAVTARRMRKLLDDGSDRAGVLARFVAELDPAEERLLAELLDRRDR
jgi:predicted transcriptional regulator